MRFMNEWRTFKHPLKHDIVNVSETFITCARLHNFCINRKNTNNFFCPIPSDEELANVIDSPSATEHVPAGNHTDDGDEMIIEGGNSALRDVVVEEIAGKGLARSPRNVTRNSS